jgi:hypothetical protein
VFGLSLSCVEGGGVEVAGSCVRSAFTDACRTLKVQVWLNDEAEEFHMCLYIPYTGFTLVKRNLNMYVQSHVISSSIDMLVYTVFMITHDYNVQQC